MTTPKTITLHWQKFGSMTEAGDAFYGRSCVYAQTDSDGNVIRVGKTTIGLRGRNKGRYNGGTGYAIDAAMHASGNLVFVAPVAIDACKQVESILLWNHRDQLIYNNEGKRREPQTAMQIRHLGMPPTFSVVSRATRSARPIPQSVTEPISHSASPRKERTGPKEETMKNSLRCRIPLTIKTEEDLRQLWAEFKDYERSGESGYVKANQNTRLTGAALFVDFLCGVKPKKKTFATSYLRYPDSPWPLD